MIGKKNMVFGFVYFLATLGLGIYLGNQLSEGGPEWAESMRRVIVRAAHAHGNLESTLNIVIGYLLCRLALDAWLAKTVSWLLIVAAVFHSGMLYLAGFGVSWAGNLTPVGAISLIAAMLLMAFGVSRLSSID